MGSEQGMGWHWITGLARYCNLYIISEGEYRPQVEDWMADSEHKELAESMHFYWNPVSDKVRKRCWRQGNWLFYFSYEQWQKKTEQIAYQIIEKEHIDILHQLNMTGFREPGYLWRVSKQTGIPFVWGPIGGMQQFPYKYFIDGGMGFCLFYGLKHIINSWQRKSSARVKKAIIQANLLVAATHDTEYHVQQSHKRNTFLIPDAGCYIQQDIKKPCSDKPVLKAIWVGKFDFRKRLDIALKSIAATNGHDIELDVYGSGNEKQIHHTKKLIEELNIPSKVRLMGQQSHDSVQKAMQEADVMLFTSVSEGTPNAVVEAISNHLPVICFDACGMATVVDESVGRKIRFTNPKQSVIDFANALDYFYEHRDELQKCSDNCAEKAKLFSWDRKTEMMFHLYEEILTEKINQKIQ